MESSKKDWSIIFENRLFDGVDTKKAARVLLEHGCQVRVFADEELVLSPTSSERIAGIVLSGKATVTTPDPKHGTLLRYLGVGELFGIANLFGNAPYISLIRANRHCRIFCMTEAAIRRLLEEDHTFLYQYLAFLSGRIRYLNQKIGYLTAGGAERRLALYLASRGEERIELDASISALSELLDVGRASLYRAFDRLIADGFLKKEGRVFILLDSEGMLRAYQ